MNDPIIHVSANVLAFQNGKVLMGLRKNVAGAGQWGFVGGHVEFNERIDDCAKREFKEETGLNISDLEYLGVINQPGQNGKHYIHFVFRSDVEGQPLLLEPDVCEKWEWFNPAQLPENIFFAHQKYLATLDSNRELIEEIL